MTRLERGRVSLTALRHGRTPGSRRPGSGALRGRGRPRPGAAAARRVGTNLAGHRARARRVGGADANARPGVDRRGDAGVGQGQQRDRRGRGRRTAARGRPDRDRPEIELRRGVVAAGEAARLRGLLAPWLASAGRELLLRPPASGLQSPR